MSKYPHTKDLDKTTENIQEEPRVRQQRSFSTIRFRTKSLNDHLQMRE